MAENLASVEEDVERRRVDKNPFEQKFISLVREIAVPSLIRQREYDVMMVWESFEFQSFNGVALMLQNA